MSIALIVGCSVVATIAWVFYVSHRASHGDSRATGNSFDNKPTVGIKINGEQEIEATQARHLREAMASLPLNNRYNASCGGNHHHPKRILHDTSSHAECVQGEAVEESVEVAPEESPESTDCAAPP